VREFDEADRLTPAEAARLKRKTRASR